MEREVEVRLYKEYGVLHLIHQLLKARQIEPPWYQYLEIIVGKIQSILILQTDISECKTNKKEDKLYELRKLACIIVQLLNKILEKGKNSVIESTLFLTYGFGLVESFKRLISVICEIPKVKEILDEGSMVIKDYELEYNEFEDDKSLPIRLFALPMVFLFNFDRLPSFINLNSNQKIVPVNSSLTLTNESSFKFSSISIVESTVQSPSEISSSLNNSIQSKQYLYIPPLSLTRSLTDEQVQAYISSKKMVKSDEYVLSLRAEIWEEFQNVLQLFFCTLAEMPDLNEVHTKYFQKELVLDNECIRSSEDLKASHLKQIDINEKCSEVIRQFKRYKHDIFSSIRENSPTVLYDFVWRNYFDDIRVFDLSMETNTKPSINFGDLLFFEIVRWYMQRRLNVRELLESMQAEVFDYCNELQAKVEQLKLEEQHENENENVDLENMDIRELDEVPETYTTVMEITMPEQESESEEVRKKKQEQYQKLMSLDLEEALNKLIIKSDEKDEKELEPISIEEIFEYAKSKEFEISKGETQITNDQWEKIILPYLERTFQKIESDPNYTIDEFILQNDDDDNNTKITPDRHDQIARNFIKYRNQTMSKVSSKLVASVLYEYVKNCIFERIKKFPLLKSNEDNLDLIYELGIKFYGWLANRERNVKENIRKQELKLLDRITRDEKKLKNRPLNTRKRSINGIDNHDSSKRQKK
ncbi:hypothetical protein K4I79_005085 [Candida tropicalis]